MGELGTESIHAHLMKLEKPYLMESIRLKYIMEHMLESFIYFPETTSEEKSQSSADSSNSSDSDYSYFKMYA